MEKRVVALGFFDGVHLGHGALLERTLTVSRETNTIPAVFTFAQSPKAVVTGKPLPLLSTPTERQWLIERLYGISQITFAPFDTRMMTLPWDRFLTEILVEEQGAVSVVVGHDFHFGYRNEGNPQKLQAYCQERGIGCDIIPAVKQAGEVISSTKIRSLVQQGALQEAADRLGHPHILTQTVQHGQKLGRTMGLPTVNFSVTGERILPPQGVYITRTILPNGTSYPSVTNIGVRPTVGNGLPCTVESFLLDFHGDLYGQTLTLAFYEKLREEQRFPDLTALQNQIQKDCIKVKSYFAKKQQG